MPKRKNNKNLYKKFLLSQYNSAEDAGYKGFIELLFDKYPDAEISQREDGRLEWICEHGVGHTVWSARRDFVHGCDGCCDLKEKKPMITFKKAKNEARTRDMGKRFVLGIGEKKYHLSRKESLELLETLMASLDNGKEVKKDKKSQNIANWRNIEL